MKITRKYILHVYSDLCVQIRVYTPTYMYVRMEQTWLRLICMLLIKSQT